jgi:hypothetical protein
MLIDVAPGAGARDRVCLDTGNGVVAGHCWGQGPAVLLALRLAKSISAPISLTLTAISQRCCYALVITLHATALRGKRSDVAVPRDTGSDRRRVAR